MREGSRITFGELALNADEAGQLLGCTGRKFLNGTSAIQTSRLGSPYGQLPGRERSPWVARSPPQAPKRKPQPSLLCGTVRDLEFDSLPDLSGFGIVMVREGADPFDGEAIVTVDDDPVPIPILLDSGSSTHIAS